MTETMKVITNGETESKQDMSVNPVTVVTDSWTPGTIAAGGYTLKTFTATGVKLGDIVNASLNIDLNGGILAGYVQAADTVALQIVNRSGSPLVLGAATVKIEVRRL